MESPLINFGLGLADLTLMYWIIRVLYSAIHPGVKPVNPPPINPPPDEDPLIPLIIHTNPKDPCPDPCPDITVPGNIVHVVNGAASGLSYTQAGWVFVPQYEEDNNHGVKTWELSGWSVRPPPEAHCYNINYPDSVSMKTKVALDPLTGKAHVSFTSTQARNRKGY